MTEQEIIEGNKLIAEFMGAEFGRIDIAIKYPESIPSWAFQLNDFDMIKVGGYDYCTSWDWLMPVVEKIESIHDEYHGYFAVHIYSNSCTIQGTKFDPNDPEKSGVYFSDPLAVLDTKIESTWYNVVQFIKWHKSH